MAVKIVETFGYLVSDHSLAALQQRGSKICPFIGSKCWKYFRSGALTNGTCVVKSTEGPEVIICPDRLYADSFKILRDVAEVAFGPAISLVRPADLAATQGQPNRVVTFGKRAGKELRIRKSAESDDEYSSDWMLALLDAQGIVQAFTPVEVQTMDTTGSYQREWYQLYTLELPENCNPTPPGLNWENVNKRIIAQLLIKGNVFSREVRCTKGLFFVCPEPVYDSLVRRLGAKLSSYPLTSGALTFRRYQLDSAIQPGTIRKLVFTGQFTTSMQNFRDAYNSTLSLPDMGIVEQTINAAIQNVLMPRKKRGRKLPSNS